MDAGVDPLRAAWLLGAAAAGRRALGASPAPLLREELAETMRTAQATASAAPFQAAHRAGERAPLEKAIARALQEARAAPAARVGTVMAPGPRSDRR
ncbi:MAG: hypothetical protein JOZ81_05240 [Chloroflexi bacterium]|nr:hypothetical protein [Chloroflexota bacterium]